MSCSCQSAGTVRPYPEGARNGRAFGRENALGAFGPLAALKVDPKVLSGKHRKADDEEAERVRPETQGR